MNSYGWFLLLLWVSVCDNRRTRICKSAPQWQECDELKLKFSQAERKLLGNFATKCGKRDVPLCAEILSRRLMQDMICSALGLNYTDSDDPSSFPSRSCCYSRMYQMNNVEGRPARLSCSITKDYGTRQDITDGTLSFHSLGNSSSTSNKKQLLLKLVYMTTQHNKTSQTNLMCVYMDLNISSEEWYQIIPLVKDGTAEDCTANNSINYTVNSLTSLTVATQPRTPQTIPADDPMVPPPECKCPTNLAAWVAVGLLFILLVSVITVLCIYIVLVHSRHCCKKYRHNNRARGDNLGLQLETPLSSIRYIQMRSGEGEGDVRREEDEGANVGAYAGEGAYAGTADQETEEAHYDQPENCTTRGQVVSTGYSRLNHE